MKDEKGPEEVCRSLGDEGRKLKEKMDKSGWEVSPKEEFWTAERVEIVGLIELRRSWRGGKGYLLFKWKLFWCSDGMEMGVSGRRRAFFTLTRQT